MAADTDERGKRKIFEQVRREGEGNGTENGTEAKGKHLYWEAGSSGRERGRTVVSRVKVRENVGTIGQQTCSSCSYSVKGRGLVLDGRDDAKPGDVLLKESPLCSMQSTENRMASPCCAQCHAFLGDVNLHAALLMQRVDRQSLLRNQDEQTILPEIFGFKNKLTDDVLMCQNGCGEFYCSETCRAAHWERSHRLLCVGALENSSHALIKFKMHAINTNDIFLLAAEVIAAIICRVMDTGCSVEEASRPYVFFERGPWWETSSGGDEEIAAQMKSLATESVCLLSEAMESYAASMPELFTLYSYGCIIGTFELNNIGISFPSPLVGYANNLEAGECEDSNLLADSISKLADVCKTVHNIQELAESERSREPEIEYEKDETFDEDFDVVQMLSNDIDADTVAEVSRHIFPMFEGTGLYTMACMMNHSCVPNVHTTYTSDGRGPAIATIVAIQNISPGEELRHSYVDEDADFDERQSLLKDNYRFICTCPKCLSENPNHLQIEQ